ncbi:hypothetical protein Moror_10165 [Moniliophthora roreri MCA 2997]|uniref:Uncharacterized protein n=2 Tax=Moniliophthora roreri TaxID=221103 RepID=V2WUZ6_MONRO|nr:hypothetical protein Moror_10165 [Moniliophthora roreri MCA 2997]
MSRISQVYRWYSSRCMRADYSPSLRLLPPYLVKTKNTTFRTIKSSPRKPSRELKGLNISRLSSIQVTNIYLGTKFIHLRGTQNQDTIRRYARSLARRQGRSIKTFLKNDAERERLRKQDSPLEQPLKRIPLKPITVDQLQYLNDRLFVDFYSYIWNCYITDRVNVMYNKLVKTFPKALPLMPYDRHSVFTHKKDIRKALYHMLTQQYNLERCPDQWELFDTMFRPIPQAVYEGLDLPDVNILAHRLRYELMSVEERFWHLYDSAPEDWQQEITDAYKMGRMWYLLKKKPAFL